MTNVTPQKILLVDDDANLLESLGEFFEVVLDSKCFRARGLSEVIAGKPQVLEATIAILDINLGAGEPSGIDVYRWLCSQAFRGNVAFLTGHAKDHPLVKEATQIEGVRVFEKPMEIDQLIALIERAAPCSA